MTADEIREAIATERARGLAEQALASPLTSAEEAEAREFLLSGTPIRPARRGRVLALRLLATLDEALALSTRLADYAEHGPKCATWYDYQGRGPMLSPDPCYRCTCGLDELLAEL